MSEMTDPRSAEATPLDAVEPVHDQTADDLATLLARREQARPNRMTWALVALLLVAVGFGAGALAFRTWGTSSTTSPFAALAEGGGFPGGGTFPGAGDGTDATGTATGAGGTGGFGGQATTGTVTLVDGTTLYVTTSDGSIVKVTVPDDATITSSQAVSLSDLAAGDTVIVRGETGDDGTVTATTVVKGALPTGTQNGTTGTDPGTDTSPSARPTTGGN